MDYDQERAAWKATILGKPVVFAADMPTAATNAVAMAYGDFKQAYQIVDRKGISVLRDPFTNKPFIASTPRSEWAAAVVNYEAVALQALSTVNRRGRRKAAKSTKSLINPTRKDPKMVGHSSYFL